MRECWINVYATKHGHQQGCFWPTLGRARHATQLEKSDNQPTLYRLHVRLKPAKAPARYMSDAERQMWDAPLTSYLSD